MKPDEKYMGEINLKRHFKFIPPSFDRSLIIEDNKSNDNMNNENDYLDLYPSETDEDQLYCYYNSVKACNNTVENKKSNSRTPEPFEVLRCLDLDMDETSNSDNISSQNNIDKIYNNIITNHSSICNSLSLYGMPSPIIKVITKRLIKLSLLYNNRK